MFELSSCNSVLLYPLVFRLKMHGHLTKSLPDAFRKFLRSDSEPDHVLIRSQAIPLVQTLSIKLVRG